MSNTGEKLFFADACLVCGVYVPEGNDVCTLCRRSIFEKKDTCTVHKPEYVKTNIIERIKLRLFPKRI